jgi:hypothetical protein
MGASYGEAVRYSVTLREVEVSSVAPVSPTLMLSSRGERMQSRGLLERVVTPGRGYYKL